ncbi:hypothetical protein ACI514_11090 [Pseudomonas sp. M20]|uniref:hypothetical protein n=1 Tax=Pseudomonas sp. M20 TaxID=3379129 RepID=UPI003863EB72
MSSFKALISLLMLTAPALGLWAGNYCYADSSVQRPIVRGYEGNGGVTVELVMSGTPAKEWALLRIRGVATETESVVHQASVQRSPVSTSFVETINGVSRTIFEVRMHQGFLPRQDQENHVLGESARLERLSDIGSELPRFESERYSTHAAGTQTVISASRP